MKSVEIWHRRTKKLVSAVLLAFGAGFLPIAFVFPTQKGIVWAIACAGLMLALVALQWRPIFAPDHPLVIVNQQGLWIKGITKELIPWNLILTAEIGLLYELNSAVFFRLRNEALRDELVAKYKNRKYVVPIPSDIHFVVPVGKDPQSILATVNYFMTTANCIQRS